ncbi:MAG: NADH-quinone oxidoreductase subunit J, partial [Gemmatimonadota bacterium]
GGPEGAMSGLLWWIFASLAFVGGLGMVTRKNPVASLLFLVLSLFSLAALFILMGAHFIGAIQVIVYAGAIMVLFLFVIMLLNLGHDMRADLRSVGWLLAGSVTAGLIGGLLGYTVWSALGLNELSVAGGAMIDEAVREQNAVGAIAYPLFRDYVVPFELTSILLLVAVVGAVLLAKRRV